MIYSAWRRKVEKFPAVNQRKDLGKIIISQRHTQKPERDRNETEEMV